MEAISNHFNNDFLRDNLHWSERAKSCLIKVNYQLTSINLSLKKTLFKNQNEFYDFSSTKFESNSSFSNFEDQTEVNRSDEKASIFGISKPPKDSNYFC